MQSNIAILEHAGFSAIEAKVYLVILADGLINGNQIAERLDLNRTVVYRALRKLASKGYLVSTGEKYDCKYSVGDVELVLKKAEQSVSVAQQNYSDLKSFVDTVPMLSMEQVLKSKVKVYRGEDSITKIYQEKNRSGDALLREISNDLVFPNIPDGFWDTEIAVRITNKSFLHQLVDHSDDSEKYHRTSVKQFKEVRVIPNDFVMSAGINIYGHKVAFHNNSIASPLAIIIEDKAMSDLMRSFFDFVWNRSQVI
jgi:sugar-specific transcriptional regulator TrmB